MLLPAFISEYSKCLLCKNELVFEVCRWNQAGGLTRCSDQARGKGGLASWGVAGALTGQDSGVGGGRATIVSVQYDLKSRIKVVNLVGVRY